MNEKSASLTSVAVFCGSSSGHNPQHMELADQLGASIAERGLKLIYGGGGRGIMGAVAMAAHKRGADILGVVPEILKQAEGHIPEIRHEIVEDMHARKIRMYTEADAFIILPGGIGTLEEAIEVLSWQNLRLHEKPILFLSNTGYWDGLFRVMHQLISDGFAPEDLEDDVLTATSVEDAFETIQERLDNPIDRAPLIIGPASVETLA